MHRTRLALLGALAAALIVGVIPAAAGGNDWGTWKFSSRQGRTWTGTFYDAHRVQGIVMGTKSLVKYNSITYFKIGSHTCKISTKLGTGYCYSLNIPANKTLKWTATTRAIVGSSDGLVPCIEYDKKYHCRYGNG